MVGLVIGGFEFAVWPMRGIGAVMEAAVGQGTAKAFVEEEEQECDLEAFGGEAVGIASAVALQERVAFQLAQIVAELVQAIGFWRKVRKW